MTNTKEISDAIAELRREITELDDTDDGTREQLIGLADLMETRLQGDQLPSNPPPVEAVKELIETYEARHPRVIAMANDLMTRLAAMGI